MFFRVVQEMNQAKNVAAGELGTTVWKVEKTTKTIYIFLPVCAYTIGT